MVFFAALNFWNTRDFLHFPTVGPTPAEFKRRMIPFSSVPVNYSQQLHFHIYTATEYNSLNSKDCGGYNVLWELYFLLLQQIVFEGTTHYHADNVELQDIDIDVVVVYPEVV